MASEPVKQSGSEELVNDYHEAFTEWAHQVSLSRTHTGSEPDARNIHEAEERYRELRDRLARSLA